MKNKIKKINNNINQVNMNMLLKLKIKERVILIKGNINKNIKNRKYNL